MPSENEASKPEGENTGESMQNNTNDSVPPETTNGSVPQATTNGSTVRGKTAEPRHALPHAHVPDRLEDAARIADRIETREAICRVIQFGSKFISGGTAGAAHEVDASTASARKVFWLLKTLNELDDFKHGPKEDVRRLKLFFNSKCAIMGVYYLLDNIVWMGRMGIYKNKQHIDMLEFVSFVLYLGGSACGCVNEAFGSNSSSTHDSSEQRWGSKKLTRERLLGITKYGLDMVVAVGLLPLQKKIVPPRVTGACGVASALITLLEVAYASHILDHHDKPHHS